MDRHTFVNDLDPAHNSRTLIFNVLHRKSTRSLACMPFVYSLAFKILSTLLVPLSLKYPWCVSGTLTAVNSVAVRSSHRDTLDYLIN
jgi:hypothetical protein